MRISDKLGFGVIETQNILRELDQMLDSDSATVYISSTGERLVSVNSYEGSVEIDQVVQTFFRAEPFSHNMSTPNERIDRVATLQERAPCFAIRNKIENLYKMSDVLLTNTSYLFQAWCWFCSIPSMVAQNRDMRSFLNIRTSEIVCRFSPEDFRRMFPGQKPAYTYSEIDYEDSFGNGPLYPVWCATEEMICQAVR